MITLRAKIFEVIVFSSMQYVWNLFIMLKFHILR